MVFSNFLKNLGNCIKFSNLTVLLSKKGLTMPLTVATNKERRDSLVSGGGLKQDTLQWRQKAAEDFDRFIQQSQTDEDKKTLEDILESSNLTYLEECLMNYFEAFRVGVRDEDGVVSVGLPKKNTLESAKSDNHICVHYICGVPLGIIMDY